MTESLLMQADLLVVTADQVASRRTGDRVPQALDALRDRVGKSAVRGFARTAGDEIQGLLADSAATVRTIETLTRLGGWRIGVGVGPVDRPISGDVRAANGPAFVDARAALIAARSAPQDLRLVSSASDGSRAADAEAMLWLLVAVWRRRTSPGWAAVDAVAGGRQQQQIARDLGVTPSAVSQRLRAALYDEAAAGEAAAVRLLDRLRDGSVGVAG